MAKQTINIGTSANDGTGSTLREAFDITNDNFTELYDGTGGLLHKIEGTNFTGSLLIGHSTTGTLSSATNNVGIGIEALQSLTSGDRNIAIGKAAGKFINSATANILIGDLAGDSLTSGGSNIAIGRNALSSEDTTGSTVAIGHRVLQNQNAASNSFNVAIGHTAGKEVTTGIKNTLIGGLAGDALTTGQDNTMLGYNAGTDATGNNNTFIGSGAGSSITGGTNNIMIGKDTDLATNASNSIVIGTGAGSGSIGSNTIVFGDSNITDVIIPSDSTLKIGASSDLQLEHVSSNSFIKNTAVGDLYIENQVADADVIFRANDAAGGLTTHFFLDGSLGSGGFTIFPDNTTLGIGGNADLRIKHDGTNSLIQNIQGDLTISNTADDKDIIFQSDDGSGNTTTYFFLDGSNAFSQVLKDFYFLDNVKARFGDGGDLQIYHDGTDSRIYNNAGDFVIRNQQDDGDIKFQSDDGSGGVATYFTIDGGATTVAFSQTITQKDSKYIGLGDSFDFHLQHNGTNSVITNSTGNLEIRQNADDADIIFYNDDGSGGTTEYFRLDGGNVNMITSVNNVFVDNKQAAFGDSADLRLQHSSGNNSSYIQNYTGDLYIENLADDKDIIFKSDDGSGGTTEYFRLAGNQVMTIASKAFNFTDNVKALFGSSHDLEIYHNGTNSHIDNNVGNLNIRQFLDDGDITFNCDDGSGGTTEYFRIDGGEGRLVHSVNSRYLDSVVAMFGAGGDMLVYHSGSTGYIENHTGHFQLIQQVDDGDILFKTDDGSGGTATYIKIDGGSENVQFPKSVFLYDDVFLNLGNSFDLRLYHDGHSNIKSQGVGNLIISQTVDDGDIIFKSDDGSGGLATYMTVDGSATKVTLQKDLRADDGVKIQVGSSGDLFMVHESDTGKITNGTGQLQITQNVADEDIVFKADGGSGSAVEYMRLDGSQTSIRMKRQVKWDDNIKATFGDGDDLEIYHDGGNSVIDNFTGDLYISNKADDKDIIFRSDDGSGGFTPYFRLDGSDERLIVEASNGMLFYDNRKAKFGNGGDLEIYHDGGNSLIQNTTGELLLRDNDTIRLQKDNGENMLRAVADGEVELYHNNVKKLDTRTTGIRIAGVSEYADNTAAIAGGLTTGDVYRTGDLLKIVH